MLEPAQRDRPKPPSIRTLIDERALKELDDRRCLTASRLREIAQEVITEDSGLSTRRSYRVNSALKRLNKHANIWFVGKALIKVPSLLLRVPYPLSPSMVGFWLAVALRPTSMQAVLDAASHVSREHSDTESIRRALRLMLERRIWISEVDGVLDISAFGMMLVHAAYQDDFSEDVLRQLTETYVTLNAGGMADLVYDLALLVGHAFGNEAAMIVMIDQINSSLPRGFRAGLMVSPPALHRYCIGVVIAALMENGLNDWIPLSELLSAGELGTSRALQGIVFQAIDELQRHGLIDLRGEQPDQRMIRLAVPEREGFALYGIDELIAVYHQSAKPRSEVHRLPVGTRVYIIRPDDEDAPR